MINDSVPLIHDAVTDIPLTCVNNVQVRSNHHENLSIH